MERTRCPVERAAEELGSKIEVTPDICAVCELVTMNTTLVTYKNLRIDYINACTAVTITVGAETITIPNLLFNTLLGQMMEKADALYAGYSSSDADCSSSRFPGDT